MIFSLGCLDLMNLPSGRFTKTRISPETARTLLEARRASGDLVGVYEFGPVPDAHREGRFREILDALESAHAISVPAEAFFTRIGGDDDPDSAGADGMPEAAPDETAGGESGEVGFEETAPAWIPVPPVVVSIAPGRPMLVVEYVFEVAPKTEGGGATGDFLSRMRVAADRLKFHLIEVESD